MKQGRKFNQVDSSHKQHAEGYWLQNAHGPLHPTLNKQIASTVVMWILVILIAIGVVYSKHNSRLSHIKLQSLNSDTISLKNEYGKLLLEKATWSAAARVEQIAKDELDMQMPSKVEIVKP